MYCRSARQHAFDLLIFHPRHFYTAHKHYYTLVKYKYPVNTSENNDIVIVKIHSFALNDNFCKTWVTESRGASSSPGPSLGLRSLGPSLLLGFLGSFSWFFSQALHTLVNLMMTSPW